MEGGEPLLPPLFAELNRRRVFRALIAYGIAAFAVLQIIEPIMHGLHWPDAVLSYVVVALAVGFPIVVSVAWIFDVNAGRMERSAHGPATAPGGVRLWLLLIGMGVFAAAPGMIWYFSWRGIHRPAVSASGDSGPSIAVLPFANLSSDKDQEYFSDGIAEEILNALAQVKGLRVIGRTSSFSFKGKGEDLRAIGEKLHAANLLEGSVRRSGARVRVTAQLIEAAGGSHLWSQEFDRELTDVFAVQDEIARSVVVALKIKLLPAQRALGEEGRTPNPEAHDQYLLGRHFIERGSREGYALGLRALEKAVALDPGYAPAWAALAYAISIASDQDPARHDPSQSRPKSLAAAERAIALAPDLADGYAARGFQRFITLTDWAGARADLDHALSLSPGSAEILVRYSFLLGALGRLPEAIATARKGTVLDPLSAEAWLRLSALYLGSGELDLAEMAAKRTLDLSPEQERGARNLGFAYLLAGRPGEARAAFRRSNVEFYSRMGDALVEQSLGRAADAQHALEEVLRTPDLAGWSFQIAQLYAFRGEADKTFEWLDRAYQYRDSGLRYLKFDPFLRAVRGDPRYAALLKKMNLPPD